MNDVRPNLSSFEKRPFDDADVRPRRTSFAFPSTLPKLWMEGSSIKTHFWNGINLFLPAFEEFMVRVMHDQYGRIEDPALRAQVRGFMGQEATHSKAHDAYNRRLREQGYRIDAYLKVADFVFEEVLEKRLGTKVSLSAIAGFEHLTATLAEIVLKHDVMAPAPAVLRELWEWHAAEETEHKALAFDYLRAVDDGYALRALGGLFGASIVFGFILSGMTVLAAQDPGFLGARSLRDADELFFGEYRILPRFLEIFTEYFKPGFHPSDRPTRQYAERVFAT